MNSLWTRRQSTVLQEVFNTWLLWMILSGKQTSVCIIYCFTHFDDWRGNVFFCLIFAGQLLGMVLSICLCKSIHTEDYTKVPKYWGAPCRQRLGQAADAQKQSERERVRKLCIFLQPVFRCKIVLYIPLDLLWHLRLFFFFLHFSFAHFRCYGCLWNERIFWKAEAQISIESLF